MSKKKQSNKDIDLALVKRAKAGDCRAFDLLVVKYQSRLISLAYKFSKDLQLAEDIVQDSLIKSFKSLHSFREDSSFYTWVYRITVNTSKNFLFDSPTLNLIRSTLSFITTKACGSSLYIVLSLLYLYKTTTRPGGKRSRNV